MSMRLLRSSAKRWTPRNYQKRAVKFLLEHACGLLLQDPGLGKTAETLAGIKLLLKKGAIERALIVAPLRVMGSTWPREIEKWKDFEDMTYTILHGPKKDTLLADETDIHLINPEGLDWLLNATGTTAGNKIITTPDMRRLRDLEYGLLVIDEVARFKHKKSNRSRNMFSVLGTFGRRWGLTGSPAPNGLLDLFGQCLVIDGGATFGQYITHYRKKYFYKPVEKGFRWEIQGEWVEKEIYKKLSRIALTMRAEDYIEMPQVIENDIKIDLPPDARRIYNHFEKELIAQIDENVITAANAGVKSVKCRQLANGGVYVDQDIRALVKLPKKDREWTELHSEKIDALDGLVSELQGQPLLIAYDFGHDLMRLNQWYMKRFGLPLPYIGSGVNLKKQNELENLWNAGRLPVLAGHPASMGHGLNLQESGYNVCWFAMTWDFDLYDQFIRRVRRQGQKAKQVFVHHILARNTVDIDMLYALKNKRRGQDALFDALKTIKRRRNGTNNAEA